MLKYISKFLFKVELIFHCMYLPHFAYPFIFQWILELLSHFSYCESCCSEHGVYKYLFETWPFNSFKYISRSRIVGSKGNFILGRIAVLFSTVAVPFYLLTNDAQGFQFLYILANTWNLFSVGFSLLNIFFFYG